MIGVPIRWALTTTAELTEPGLPALRQPEDRYRRLSPDIGIEPRRLVGSYGLGEPVPTWAILTRGCGPQVRCDSGRA